MAAIANSLAFERKYTSGVISWAPEDQPTAEEIGAVLDEFEKTARAAQAPDRSAWTAVLHREHGTGVHVHVLTARYDLETGRGPEHRAARLAEDLRRAARRLQPPARLEPPRRPGAPERTGPATGLLIRVR